MSGEVGETVQNLIIWQWINWISYYEYSSCPTVSGNYLRESLSRKDHLVNSITWTFFACESFTITNNITEKLINLNIFPLFASNWHLLINDTSAFCFVIVKILSFVASTTRFYFQQLFSHTFSIPNHINNWTIEALSTNCPTHLWTYQLHWLWWNKPRVDNCRITVNNNPTSSLSLEM